MLLDDLLRHLTFQCHFLRPSPLTYISRNTSSSIFLNFREKVRSYVGKRHVKFGTKVLKISWLLFELKYILCPKVDNFEKFQKSLKCGSFINNDDISCVYQFLSCLVIHTSLCMGIKDAYWRSRYMRHDSSASSIPNPRSPSIYALTCVTVVHELIPHHYNPNCITRKRPLCSCRAGEGTHYDVVPIRLG